MSLFLNKVIQAGRLGCNPDIRYFKDGRTSCQFSLAVKKTWKTPDGTKQEKTSWIPVRFSGAIVENLIEKYVAMGDNVLIEGEWDDFTLKDEVSGRTYKSVYLNGKDIKIIEKAKAKTAAETEQSAPPPSDDDNIPY